MEFTDGSSEDFGGEGEARVYFDRNEGYRAEGDEGYKEEGGEGYDGNDSIFNSILMSQIFAKATRPKLIRAIFILSVLILYLVQCPRYPCPGPCPVPDIPVLVRVLSQISLSWSVSCPGP